MSLEIFKQNMLLYMQNQNSINSLDDFAKKLTSEYDFTIRRGFQTVNNVKVQETNTDLMETMVRIALLNALQIREGTHNIVEEIGKGIVAYWTGASLNQFPTPIVPATGAVQNISTTSALVTDPGTFPTIGNQIPSSESNLFLDQLVLGITIHLLSLKGVYYTTSLYPGAPPPPPAPGIVQWQGYNIPS